MLVLTVQQPFAWAIVTGKKDIENRCWKPPEALIGKRFAIHAGISRSRPEVVQQWQSRGKLDPEDLVYGAILGTVVLSKVVTKSNSKWFGGPYGWVLKSPRRFRKPIRKKGQLRLWSYPL